MPSTNKFKHMRGTLNLPIVGLQGLTYEEKLRELNLCTLVERRKKFDMVQVFKILRGIDNVDFSTWFTLVLNEDIPKNASPQNFFWNFW